MPLFPTQTKQSQSFSLHEYPKAKLPLPPLWSPQEKKKKSHQDYWFVTFTVRSEIRVSNCISLYLSVLPVAVTGTRHKVNKLFGTCRD